MPNGFMIFGIFLWLALFLATGVMAQDDNRFKGLNRAELQELVLLKESQFKAEHTELIDEIRSLLNQLDQEKALAGGFQLRLSELETELTEKSEKVSELERRQKVAHQEIDSLKWRLNLAASISNSRQGFGPYGQRVDFDFSYGNNAWGTNPVELIAVGWSRDGKFLFMEEFCDGGCGCCGASINVFDATNGRLLVNEWVDMEVVESGEVEALEVEVRLVARLNELRDEYGIISNGVGHFQKGENNRTFRCDFNVWEGDEMTFDVRETENRWELRISRSGITSIILYQVEFGWDEEFEVRSPRDVAFPGLIRSPFGHEAIVPIFREHLGFESESDWSMIPVAIPIRFLTP